MLLVIDIGNTNIVFGLFKGEKLVKTWRSLTRNPQLETRNYQVRQVVIASVVPAVDKKLIKLIKAKYKLVPYFVTAQNIPEIKVKLKNKREIGADRVVDALAAYKLYGGPAIVVDFGTATTFDVITAKGEYLGGAIAPGIDLARDALHERTAKLPRIQLKAPRSVIGNDTLSAMQSGLVFGYVALVEGMVGRLKTELQTSNFLRTELGWPEPQDEVKHPNKRQKTNYKLSIKVIATGGLAKLICKQTDIVDKIDDKLTLRGLRLIGELLQ